MHMLTNHVMTFKQYTKTHDMTHPGTYNSSDSANNCSNVTFPHIQD